MMANTCSQTELEEWSEAHSLMIKSQEIDVYSFIIHLSALTSDYAVSFTADFV